MIKTKIIHGEVDILCIAGLPADAAEINIYRNKLYFNRKYETGYNPDLEGDWQPVNWLDNGLGLGEVAKPEVKLNY